MSTSSPTVAMARTVLSGCGVSHLEQLAIALNNERTSEVEAFASSTFQRGERIRDGSPDIAVQWDPQVQAQADIVSQALSNILVGVMLRVQFKDAPTRATMVG